MSSQMSIDETTLHLTHDNNIYLYYLKVSTIYIKVLGYHKDTVTFFNQNKKSLNNQLKGYSGMDSSTVLCGIIYIYI